MRRKNGDPDETAERARPRQYPANGTELQKRQRFRCSDSKKRAKTARKQPKPSHLAQNSAHKENPPEANV